jgi:CheY-like chemotaxis protein
MQKHVLVIDDDSSVRLAFELALEDSGHHVTTVASGEAGVRTIQDHPCDLIFLDLKMPGMNGVETLAEIRKIDSDVPIYIVTAFFGEYFSELEQLKEAGLHFEVLRKPVNSRDILLLTQSILDGPIGF